MGVKKPPVKPITAVKTDFINSLQNVVDKGNLLLVVVETALQHGAISGNVADMIRERAAEFKTAMYGADDGTETKFAVTGLRVVSVELPVSIRPLFYVNGDTIFQRPVQNGDSVSMGFSVCRVCDGVDPAAVCAILNKGEPAPDGTD